MPKPRPSIPLHKVCGNVLGCTQSDVDRLPLDIERIHELAEALLPVSEQIDADLPVEDRKLNAKLVELIAILHELHPADVAGLLESLPQKERALVWHLAASGPW